MEEEMDQGWERDFSLGEGTDSDGVDARDKSPERTLASILEAAQHHLPEMLGLRGKEVSPAIQRVEAVARERLLGTYLETLSEHLSSEELGRLVGLLDDIGAHRLLALITHLRRSTLSTLRAHLTLGEALKMSVAVVPRIFSRSRKASQ